MVKIKLEELNKDSTPCEICVAMNKRDVKLNEKGNYFEGYGCHSNYNNNCIDSDKAKIKLLYLNYLINRDKF